MLEKYKLGTMEYYHALKTLSADQLKKEWVETTREHYWEMLEIVPPVCIDGTSFICGECLTYSDAGKLFRMFTIVGHKYYHRPCPLSEWPIRNFEKEILEQFHEDYSTNG